MEFVGIEHPSKAAQMRRWPEPYQRSTIGWLADVIQQREPEQQVKLWRVAKNGGELVCLVVYLPIGIDLRLMEADEFRRTVLLRDASAVMALAEDWRRKLADREWV